MKDSSSLQLMPLALLSNADRGTRGDACTAASAARRWTAETIMLPVRCGHDRVIHTYMSREIAMERFDRKRIGRDLMLFYDAHAQL